MAVNPLNNILQWNLNGLRGKITQLQCLLTKYNPEVTALQETKMPPNEPFPEHLERKFSIVKKNRTARGGGVALMINKKLSHTKLNIATNMEAVAATIHYHNQTLQSVVYISPHRYPSLKMNSKRLYPISHNHFLF